MRRWLLRGLLAYLTLSILAGIVLGEFALRRGRRPHDGAAEARAVALAAAHGATLRPVRIAAADGVPLLAWSFATGRASRGTVIVAHGAGGWRDHGTAYAAFLLDAGFDVLAPDARGHGDSGGIASYGIHEADDVRRWAAWARARAPERCVYAIGSSMGGAHVLLAEAGAPTFCAIVTDAVFASFVDAGLDRIARYLGVGEAGRWLGRPAASAGLAYVHLLYGLDLASVRPDEAMLRIRAPLLLIHGDADLNTPVYHARALARVQSAATLWIVPGARHTGAWRAEPVEFPRRIVAFFRQRG